MTGAVIMTAASFVRAEVAHSEPVVPSNSIAQPPPDRRSQSTDALAFGPFFRQVQQAVHDRDAKFIRTIVTAKTNFGFGDHRSINYLNPDNPQSPFWLQLETTIASECPNSANSVGSQISPKGVVFGCAILPQQPAETSAQVPPHRAIFAANNGRWTLQTFISLD